MLEEDLSKVNQTDIPTRSNYSLPIARAIAELAPGCKWHIIGYDYSNLVWEDDFNKKPSKEEVEAKAKEILERIPYEILRKKRNLRMREVDWVTLKSIRTGEPIPQEWKDYMQALADITETSSPKLVDGELIGVDWPERPDGKPAGEYRGF